MKGLTKIVAVVALALVLVAGVGAAGWAASAASAQTPVPTDPEGSDLNQYFWQALAGRLGTTVDQLTQAFKDAAKDTVKQGVSDGQMTQDQADRYNEHIEGWQPDQGGPWGMPFGDKGHGRDWGDMGHHGFGIFDGPAMLDAAAKTLGMTADELKTELQSGKTLADIAAEKKVDEAVLKQALVDAAKAQVDQAVAAGELTQAQADELKTKIDSLAQNFDLSQPFFVGPHGLFGKDCPEQPDAPTVPSGPDA